MSLVPTAGSGSRTPPLVAGLSCLAGFGVLAVLVALAWPPLLELENGQQWLLLESMGSYRFRAGDGIAIRRGSLGSYRASNPDRKGAWRVRRVK